MDFRDAASEIRRWPSSSDGERCEASYQAAA